MRRTPVACAVTAVSAAILRLHRSADGQFLLINAGTRRAPAHEPAPPGAALTEQHLLPYFEDNTHVELVEHIARFRPGQCLWAASGGHPAPAAGRAAR
jgi:hypothetical protein